MYTKSVSRHRQIAEVPAATALGGPVGRTPMRLFVTRPKARVEMKDRGSIRKRVEK